MTSFWDRPWLDGAKEHYDQGDWDDDDLPTCSECGRLLEPDEADFDICSDCINREEGTPDLERLMMVVIEARTDIGDEALEY